MEELFGYWATSIAFPLPVAVSQLNSNQWKSLIIPAACNAEELISVPRGTAKQCKIIKLWSQKDSGFCECMIRRHLPASLVGE